MAKISISRGFRQQHSILRPENAGMAMIAKNRIEQVVAQQNANHIESLKVQGSDLKIWLRTYSGQKCSCGCGDKQSVTNPDKPQFLEDPFMEVTVENKKRSEQDENEPFQKFGDPNLDFSEDEILQNIENYAIQDENDLVYGGDKTPCGICLGTGYKNGYQMFNGDRIVLDYWNDPITNGFLLQRTYPYSYQADFSDSNYIIWTFNAPTYFKEFCGIRVRNNIKYCKDYSLYISFDGLTFYPYEDRLLSSRNGVQTKVFLKVVPYNNPIAKANKFEITHIEVYYQLGEYIKGDFAPIEKSENFEFFEALQTTELELAGNISGIDREAIFLDPKNHKLWKVVSITPHLTEAKQIFKNELSLRMVQPSENAYLLFLLDNPYVILNYRGLEQKQNMRTYFGEYTPSH